MCIVYSGKCIPTWENFDLSFKSEFFRKLENRFVKCQNLAAFRVCHGFKHWFHIERFFNAI